MATYKLYLESSNKYRWNLNTEEGEDIFADSGRGYASKDQILQSIYLVRTLAAEALLIDQTASAPTDLPLSSGYFKLYQDRGSKYRWRLKSQEGRLISDSTHGLMMKEDALGDIHMVRELAPDATLLDLTEGGETEVPYNLGALPSELTINWPAPPRIEQTVEISAPPDDGELRVEQAHTRLIIAANLERLTLAASDIEV